MIGQILDDFNYTLRGLSGQCEWSLVFNLTYQLR